MDHVIDTSLAEARTIPLTFADLHLSPETGALRVGGRPATSRLSNQKTRALALLLAAQGALVTDERLQAAVGGTPVAAVISKIRSRLVQADAFARIVHGPGRGWRLVDWRGAAPTTFAGLTLHTEARELVISGRPGTFGLGVQQSAVLALLLAAQGKCVSPERIQEEIGLHSGVSPAAPTVGGLSARLRRVGSPAVVIHERGQGWRLADASHGELLTFAGLTLNVTTRMLTVAEHEPLSLTAQQSLILGLLMQARDQYVTASTIEGVVGTVNARSAVANLERRLRHAGAAAEIVNGRNLGWKVVGPDAHATISFAGLDLTPLTRRLQVHGHRPVTLGPRQNELLRLLINAGTGFVPDPEVDRTLGVETLGIAIFRLEARIRMAGASMNVVNQQGRGWQLMPSRSTT